jgi:hypothetical protein
LTFRGECGRLLLVRNASDPEFYERQERFDNAEYELLALIWQALLIPEGDLSLPLPGYSAAESIASPEHQDPGKAKADTGAGPGTGPGPETWRVHANLETTLDVFSGDRRKTLKCKGPPGVSSTGDPLLKVRSWTWSHLPREVRDPAGQSATLGP